MRGRPRVLVGKVGLDGHDRGAKVVALALRDAGMEVIYSGLHRAPEEIVRDAISEDVDLVGLSILSGAHLPLARRVCEGLRGTDIRVVVGGVIPAGDAEALRSAGVEEIFPTGTPLEEVVEWIRRSFAASSSNQASR
jgi:methylmalonyl-CoA mutase C-terminal domain/subunit